MQSTELKVREAVESDLNRILEIYNHEILHNTALFIYEPKDLTDRKSWFDSLMRGGYPLIVAVDPGLPENGQVVAYCSLGQFRDKPGYKRATEVSLYVHKDYRRRGLGKILTREIIERGKKAGFHNIIAGMTSDNAGSIALYKQFGFTLIGTFPEVGYKFDRWLDVTFMQLNI